jgi:hypothetical protein
MGRCKLDNNAFPNEPILTESEKADTQEFLNEMLSIFPLVEIKVFDKAKKIEVDSKSLAEKQTKKEKIQDTVIVPAQEDGFNEVFLGENKWYAIRIGGGKLNEIKYIAAYQTAPVSAITHISFNKLINQREFSTFNERNYAYSSTNYIYSPRQRNLIRGY